MNSKWFLIMVLFLAFTITSCESTKQAIKDTDDWIKKNVW